MPASIYSKQIAYEICARVAAGNSLHKICKDPEMPGRATVYEWLDRHEDFLALYNKAVDDRSEMYFDEILEIADDGTNDYNEQIDPTGEKGWKVNHEHINRSRLRIDARKWHLAKMKPRKYGEKNFNETKLDATDDFKKFLSSIDGKSTGLPNGDTEGFS